MSTLSQIRTQIHSLLEGILENRAKVYSYYESNPSQYPCVIMDISSQASEFLTDAENMSSISFQLIAMVDQSDENGLTEIQATNTLDDIVDIITQNVEQDYSLGGVVDYCVPTVGRREIVTIPNGIAKAQFFTLTTKQSVVMI